MRFHQTVMLGMAAELAIPLAGCGEEVAAPPSAPRPIAWTEVVPAEDGTIRTLSGVVRAIQRAPLSFEVAGRIDTLGVDIGDHFDAGIVLASLDPRTFELELAERTSELAEAEATEAEAASEYERQRRLFRSGWVSEAAYDRALAALETARSRVRRLEAEDEGPRAGHQRGVEDVPRAVDDLAVFHQCPGVPFEAEGVGDPLDAVFGVFAHDRDSGQARPCPDREQSCLRRPGHSDTEHKGKYGRPPGSQTLSFRETHVQPPFAMAKPGSARRAPEAWRRWPPLASAKPGRSRPPD